jgi:hypothetical protein
LQMVKTINHAFHKLSLKSAMEWKDVSVTVQKLMMKTVTHFRISKLYVSNDFQNKKAQCAKLMWDFWTSDIHGHDKEQRYVQNKLQRQEPSGSVLQISLIYQCPSPANDFQFQSLHHI